MDRAPGGDARLRAVRRCAPARGAAMRACARCGNVRPPCAAALRDEPRPPDRTNA